MERTWARPWGPLVAVIAAGVFAAPTLFLPADSPVEPKVIFIVIGSVLLTAAIVLTRREPVSPPSDEPGRGDDVTP